MTVTESYQAHLRNLLATSGKTAAGMLQFQHMTCGASKANAMGVYSRRRLCTRTANRITKIAAVLLGLMGAASAQNLSSSNVFAGYSFIGANLSSGQHANLNGWKVSAEKKYLPFFGIVADFSGHYGSKDLPLNSCTGSSQAQCLVSSSVSEHYFQAGVRGSYATERIRPFFELLFGAVHISESGPGLSNSNNSFVETLAAGLDGRITRRLGWRADAGLVKTGSFFFQQNSVRASTGLVFYF